MSIRRIPAPEPGLHLGVPMADYLAWDAWSSSDLKALLEGPEYALWYRTKREPKPTAATDFGTLAHIALLEPEAWPPKDVAWIEGPFNRNPGRALKKEAEEAGHKVVHADWKPRIEAMVARCKRHPLFAGLLELSKGMREVSAVAVCPETGILVKARSDILSLDTHQVGDLKTTTVGTDEASFRRQMKRLRYWLSAPHYQDVFAQAAGVDFDTYLWLVVGQEEPFVPRVHQLSSQTQAAGEDLMRYLRRQAAHYTETGAWVENERRVQTIGLSKFDLDEVAELLEQEAMSA